MIKSRRKKFDKFLKTLNVILFSVILIIGLVVVLVLSEKESPVLLGDVKDLGSQDKKTSMRTNEVITKDFARIDKTYIEEPEKKSFVDPDLDYAIKLFEAKINKKIFKTFKKPFNYKDGSYCKTRFYLNKEKFKFLECNGDAIYKRELQLAIEKIMPIERFTYNNINLGKKELIILISIDK